MTGREVFTRALSYLFEQTDTGGLESFAAGWLTVLLGEVLPTENSLRAYRGLEPWKTAPVVEDLEAVLPCQEEIAQVALPYGLAAWMYAEDDNDYRSQEYRGRYISALSDVQRLMEGQVVDLYA